MKILTLRAAAFLVSASASLLAQGPPPPPPLVLDLLLPSPDATGAPGGQIVMRVFRYTVPPRYAQGAPVVVMVPAGNGPGDLQQNADVDDLRAKGFIVIKFLFPGGCVPNTNIHSDGLYDGRGERCMAALRDVGLFAANQKTAAPPQGGPPATLQQFEGPLANNTGLLSMGNGGNVAMATLATHLQLAPFIKWHVMWETPSTDWQIMGGVGSRLLDANPNVSEDGNPFGNDEGDNGAYYGPSPFGDIVDLVSLGFDANAVQTLSGVACGGPPPTVQTGTYFIDGDADGKLAAPPFDKNGNGIIDPYVDHEDFPFQAVATFHEGQPKIYWPAPVLMTAQAMGLPIPPLAATVDEARQFWSQRQNYLFAPVVARRYPGFITILGYQEVQEILPTGDHMNIRYTYESLRGYGSFARLNPDLSYSINAFLPNPAPPGTSDAPGNAVLAPPAPFPVFFSNGPMMGPAEPVGGADWARRYRTASTMEAADRRQANNYVPDLNGMLF
jgi:hypothetical protein